MLRLTFSSSLGPGLLRFDCFVDENIQIDRQAKTEVERHRTELRSGML